MADNKGLDRSAIAAAAIISERGNRELIRSLEKRYNTQKNIHTVGSTNDDRMARKDAYIEEQRHQKELEHNKTILKLTEERIAAEKAGNKELQEQIKNQIRETQIKGPDEIGFDTDEVSKSFSSTLEEIATNFSEQSKAEQKAQLKRMNELKTLISDSQATEKEFLVSQLENIQTIAQKEYDKRATLAAKALDSAAGLAEQYMDISSLYAGFVDHNPIAMAMWRIGGDFIKRWRAQKKAQRESIVRDRENAVEATRMNERKMRMAEDEQRRADEINSKRAEVLDVEKKHADETKVNKPKFNKASPMEPDTMGGDEALDRDFFTDLFGSSDEDGDSVMFNVDDSDMGAIEIDDTRPVMVQQEPTEEQKAETKFIREQGERQQQINQENHLEGVEQQSKIFEKLVDIEEAILQGNNFDKKQAKKMKEDGGLLEMLGLGRVAALLAGPVTKSLMLFGPIVAGIAALLKKFGMGAIGDKLTGGFERLTGRGKGGPNVPGKAGKKPGLFKRGVGKLGKFAKSGAGVVGRAGGALVRGGAALLGSAPAMVAGAGLAGYGVGTLGYSLLGDDQKSALGNFIGKGVDSVLAGFGNEGAIQRLALGETMMARNGGNTLGIDSPKMNNPKNGKVSFTKDSDGKGPKLVIHTDRIESNHLYNTRNIEVPSSAASEQRLEMLENKIIEFKEAEKASKETNVLPVIPSKPKQNVVRPGDSSTPVTSGRSARNPDSSIQRVTDRMITYGAS